LPNSKLLSEITDLFLYRILSCCLKLHYFFHYRVEKARWEDLSKPPHNIRLVKGSVHIAASRRYVNYVIHSDIAKDFFNWTRGVKIPDELFFSTLNHNPQLKIPGSFKGKVLNLYQHGPYAKNILTYINMGRIHKTK